MLSHHDMNINDLLVCVQYKEMEQVVLEDREEQEKLRQQQAQVAAATKVATSN